MRIGNDAYHQRQNDSFGYLMDLIYQYYRLMPGSLDEIEDMWEMVKNILSTVTEEWRKPDKGIWEIRGRSRQFVSSKVMCWVALDRGAKVADLLGKNEYGRRWRREADDIRDDVMKNGWKEEIGSFSQAYDNLALDSSLLLMEPYGFIEATDPRYSRTVRAVKEALLHDGCSTESCAAPTTWGCSAKISISIRKNCSEIFRRPIRIWHWSIPPCSSRKRTEA